MDAAWEAYDDAMAGIIRDCPDCHGKRYQDEGKIHCRSCEDQECTVCECNLQENEEGYCEECRPKYDEVYDNMEDQDRE